MRLSVLADKPCAVNRKHDGELLQAYVVQQFIICALQKRRVDRHDRVQSGRSHARCHRHSVFLCDADVE